jgi:hypothetical protein
VKKNANIDVSNSPLVLRIIWRGDTDLMLYISALFL